MEEKLKDFVFNRPDSVAAYGYGSGVFKQAGYTSKDKVQCDIIIAVENLRDWHLKNMKLNPGDYSWTGKSYISHKPIEKLKGSTGIVYLSNIEENGTIFKYGTIEIDDLKKALYTWCSFYLAGRFQKLILPIVEEDELTKLIDMNRKSALYLATYLQEKDIVTADELITTVCGLSYMGDTRQKLVDKNKVSQIVTGSVDKFKTLYDFNTMYLHESNDKYEIDHDVLNYLLPTLPINLYDYISPSLNMPLEVIQSKIYEYFTELNRYESSTQTKKGVCTNGPVRSLEYGYAKLAKSLKKIRV